MNRIILILGCLLSLEMSAVAQTSPNNVSSAHDLARSLSKSFADVYERVSPSVVVIEAQAEEADGDAVVASPLIQFFGATPRIAPQETEMNQGSGFIMTADGYILTNNHVLEGASADSVRVILQDGRKLPARVVGVDRISDLAVLKVEGKNFPVIEIGDSDKTRVGEFAFAIGSPFDLRNSFTYGVISAKGRTEIDPQNPNYQEYLQTDASINPGNSGGPLVDIDGKVIGVNTLIRDLNRGLGFAIPINIARKVATQLIADGRATRPWLGIMIQSMEEMPELTQRFPDLPPGILVRGIEPGTPASLSSLRLNDIITKVDGTPVKSARELQKAILDKTVGQEIELQVWRNRRTVMVKLRTAEHTDGFLPVANQRVAPPSRPAAPDADDGAGDAAAVPPPAQTRSPSAGLAVKTLTANMALAMKLQAEEGVLVTSVEPGSEAAAAGVKVGDVVTSVGSKPVHTAEDFLQAINVASGEALMLNLNRGDEKSYAILKR